MKRNSIIIIELLISSRYFSSSTGSHISIANSLKYETAEFLLLIIQSISKPTSDSILFSNITDVAKAAAIAIKIPKSQSASTAIWW